MRACLFAAVFAIMSTPALAADQPEPKYKGKSLEYWVERLQKAETDEQQKAAAGAIAAFGLDAAPAVPELLQMLDDRSWEYRELMADLLCRIGPGAKSAVPALTKLLKEKKARDPDNVICILGAIGPDAKESVPVLIAALDDRELRSFAFVALCKIGPVTKDVLPGIRRVALAIVADEEAGKDSIQLSFRKDQKGQYDHTRQSFALWELHTLGAQAVPILLAMIEAPGKRGKEHALEEFEKLGSAGAKGVPALKKLLKHDQPEVRYHTCVALWEIEKSTDVVPVLAELLAKTPNYGSSDADPTLTDVVRLLAEIGPAAKDAIPALRARIKEQLFTNQDGTISVGRIAPGYQVKIINEAIDKIEGKSKK